MRNAGEFLWFWPDAPASQYIKIRPVPALLRLWGRPSTSKPEHKRFSTYAHFYRQAERRLAREQRRLSKMVRGSMNYRKHKVRVALAHERVRNCRDARRHKESARLSNQYDVIGVEDINYTGMARSPHLAKSSNDNAFMQFRTFLSCELAGRGEGLIAIDMSCGILPLRVAGFTEA